jgi:biotin-dependent carboxylase-like uncharacterized protein
MMLEILSVTGLATVQDGGRAGRMHEGVPPGGPLVPEMLARANAAASNAPDEASIESFGPIKLAARGTIVVGTDEGEARALRDGEEYMLATGSARVRYLAVRGGIDVPRVLGGRGTLLVASLGGHEGRPLRRGDLLRVGTAASRESPIVPAVSLDSRVRVVLGPDLDRFDARSVEAFLSSSFTVDARSDRVGIRLSGPRLLCPDDPMALSAPMVRGAIQVPPSGEPIVLGPDHPTTGGYPVIATVIRGHLGSLSARRIGARVEFEVQGQ